MVDVLGRLEELQGEARELGPLSEPSRAHVLARTAELLGAAAGCLVLDGDAGPGCRGSILESTTYNFDGVTRPAFQPLLERGSAFHPLVERMFGLHDGDPRFIQVLTSREILSMRDWRESPYYCDFVRQIGFDESIISLRNAGAPNAGHGFGFFRERGQRAFTESDKLVLRLVELVLGPYIHRPPPEPGLSPRDRDVLALLREGLSDKEIAARLGISPHTVNQRTKRLYRRFGVHSRAELLAKR
jgi:DNA-binding CsgD family transcriptional regulator